MPTISAVLRINMSGQRATGKDEADRYNAAIDMAEYADRNGFAIVNVEEHHNAQIGWLPSPLLMAGFIASRTKKIGIRASALLVPLYDPIRLAEDIAMLDLVSHGRFFFILGQGYRPVEYHMHDHDWESRGEATEFIIETLLQAWTGEPFEYRGQMVQVSPAPFTKPHPFFYYGGMSKAAVQRAAKFGLPFFPPQPMPELQEYYLAEAKKHGKAGRVEVHEDMSLLFIDDDPDRAWAELGPYLLKESQEYSSWRRGGVARHYQTESASVDELRKQGSFEIITAEECVRRAKATTGRHYKPVLHPLAGGIPLDRAWHCLELFTTKVLGQL